MDKIPWVKQHRPRSNCQHAAMHKPLFFIRPLSCSPVPCGCIQRIGQTFESLLSSCDICLFLERRPRETSAVLEFSQADTGNIFGTMHENRWRKQMKIGKNAIVWSCLRLNCSKNLRSRSPSTEWDGRSALNGLRAATPPAPVPLKIKSNGAFQNGLVLGPSSWQLLLGQSERETGRWLHYIYGSLV